MDEDTKVVDGEIVEDVKEEVEESSGETGSDQATVLLSLETLIKNNIASIDKLREELRKHRQMLEDSFMNDAVYQEHLKASKEAVKVKSATRAQILKQPQNVMLSSKAKNMAAELKDKQLALSDYLLEYQRMTGVNEIEGEDGEVREIVNTAKVVKKAKK
ncbi:MAG: hypothetical protein KGJ07_10400 [Patescibacteria group bacterium]|nr:hypothetical protein [Patescibacteria group bacterium]